MLENIEDDCQNINNVNDFLLNNNYFLESNNNYLENSQNNPYYNDFEENMDFSNNLIENYSFNNNSASNNSFKTKFYFSSNSKDISFNNKINRNFFIPVERNFVSINNTIENNPYPNHSPNNLIENYSFQNNFTINQLSNISPFQNHYSEQNNNIHNNYIQNNYIQNTLVHNHSINNIFIQNDYIQNALIENNPAQKIILEKEFFFDDNYSNKNKPDKEFKLLDNKLSVKTTTFKTEISKEEQLKMAPTQYNYKKINNYILPKIKLDEKVIVKYTNCDDVVKLDTNLSNEKYLAIKTRNRKKDNKNATENNIEIGSKKYGEKKGDNLRENRFLGRKKKNRNKDNNNVIENNIKKGNKIFGRKKKGDNSFSNHTEYSEDNIAKKIKVIFHNYSINSINSLLQSVLGEDKINSYIEKIKKIPNNIQPKIENLIKDLDYNKYANIMNKEKDLKFFNMYLKDFFSIDISPQYKNYPRDYNKKIIEEIIEKEKDNKIIIFILTKLKLRDYIDIFLYKKDLGDFENIDKESVDKIMSKFIRVEKLLEEINNLNYKNNYFSKFISLMYNLERWYFFKTARNVNIKKMKNKK